LGLPGVFDRRGRIDSLWIGVTPQDQVRELHVRIDRALRRVGIAPDGRAFLPHITIARFSRGSGGGAASFVPLVPLGGTSFMVDGFALFESSLGHDGSDYRAAEIYRIN
jgi:2'-5' RNA ligase